VLLGTIAGFFAKFIRDREKISFKNVHRYFFLACSQFVSVGAVISFSPVFYQLDKNSCVERFDELVGLIRQEEQAVLTKKHGYYSGDLCPRSHRYECRDKPIFSGVHVLLTQVSRVGLFHCQSWKF
jgi:hypothetical protein